MQQSNWPTGTTARPPHPRVWLVGVHVFHPVLPRLVILHRVQPGGKVAEQLSGGGKVGVGCSHVSSPLGEGSGQEGGVSVALRLEQPCFKPLLHRAPRHAREAAAAAC